MFSDKLIEELPDEPTFALHRLCEVFIDYDNEIAMRNTDDRLLNYSLYLDAFATFQAYSEAWGFDYNYPSLGGDRIDNINIIREFIDGLQSELEQKATTLMIQETKTRRLLQINKSLKYEFSEEDLNKVQSLINELRKEITESELFDESHRLRLLQRLENLQSELHKKIANLDRFLGLVGDAGIVLGKFGKDAKPLVDRIQEIAKIIWRTQAKVEDLPSNALIPQIGE